MNIIIKKREEANISYEQIVDLMHASFEERLQQGLNFTCSFMTVDQYKEKNSDAIIFVAIDEENGNLMGAAVVHIKRDEKKVLHGYNEYMSVSPKAKRCGIGTMLEHAREEVCKKAGCDYMMCDTAVGAVSSVKYHLKNGYKIVGLRSFASTNYYSYLFRKQLIPSKFWSNSLFCKMVYIKSAVIERIKHKQDGSKTLFALICSRMLGKK